MDIFIPTVPQANLPREDWTYVSDLLFDQLTMLAKCLPILLLRVPPRLAAATKASIVIKNCNRFLKGAWQSLALGAQQDLQVCNVLAQAKNQTAQQQPGTTGHRICPLSWSEPSSCNTRNP